MSAWSCGEKARMLHSWEIQALTHQVCVGSCMVHLQSISGMPLAALEARWPPCFFKMKPGVPKPKLDLFFENKGQSVSGCWLRRKPQFGKTHWCHGLSHHDCLQRWCSRAFWSHSGCGCSLCTARFWRSSFLSPMQRGRVGRADTKDLDPHWACA